ncbi:MAG: hypothetical protein NTV31_06970 [Bacteroidia bacterium]|jgi:hypothetical protein|nr:hypothetical protein [Bacteroidia bacterium]
MELFKNIRLKIGKAIFRKKIARTNRKVYYKDFSMIKNIGIVWDASKTDEFAALSRFYQKMHERNIEVKILGFFAGKNLPDQYTAIRYLTCIRKKEINIFYHPVSSETNNFINNRFEILIDINFKKLFPLQYISSLSNAGFKVGLFESETIDTPFDLMMEIKKPVDVENYLNQVVHYLEMINSGAFKTVDK